MRNRCAYLVVVMLAVFTANAQAYSALYVFGDSLSDNGNNALALGGFGIPQTVAPFKDGDSPAPLVPVGTYAGSNNYSNGPVWVDYLANALGLPLAPSLIPGGTNFAFGGARTGAIGVSDDPGLTPPLTQQAGSAVAGSLGTLASDALYVVWGGGNDLRALGAEFGAGLASPDPLVQQQAALALTSGINASIANLTTTLSTLADAGARDFLIPNLPDLGLTPTARFLETVAPGTRALLSGLSGLFNDRLANLISGADGVDGFTLTLFDVFALNHAAVDNPAPGVNVTDACTSQNNFTGCSNPDSFVYWDGVHPTTATHQVIAAAALNALQPVPVPASLPLAVGGMLMLAGVARRRRAA